MKQLLTGNEAVARGVYEAGVKFAAAYPGTPSTEILENISRYREMIAEWAPNEKVALETAIGASLAGARAIASMKHVGLNVAADALLTVANTGITGGLVVVTADEPGMHSSQNEQDNRHYAELAKIPMLEPSDSKECLEMTKYAFELSEKYETPVLLRLTTRICHSKGIVETGERVEKALIPYVKNEKKYVTVPANARVNRVKVEQKLHDLKALAEQSQWNYTEENGSKIGVVACGQCFYYAKEVFGAEVDYLKIGFSYPAAEEKMREFCKRHETVYVLEENDPILENQLKSFGCNVIGKDVFPPYGELMPYVIRESLTHQSAVELQANPADVVARPPSLCAGCPHRGLFLELGKRKDVIVAGDIGCYTLAYGEPYRAMDWNMCMGGSISTAHGAQKILEHADQRRVVAVIGDSTFFHTGINSLINVVYNKANTVTVILDNRITGMTGHQQNPGTGFTAQNEPTHIVDIEALVRAAGIRQVRVVDPNRLNDVREALDWALSLQEPSVVITRYPCALKKLTEQDRTEFDGAFRKRFFVAQDVCKGCKMCLQCGCPAIEWEQGKAKINAQCLGCGVCAQVCRFDAIREGKHD